MNVCRMAAVVLVALALLVGLHAEAARHQYERQQLPGSRIMKSWPVEITDSGGVLLLSDSPEYVQEYGILYSDVVRGDARIFYYHVNVTPRPGKLAVILENQGTKSTSVAVLRGGMAEPGANYFAVGKTLSQSYMEAAGLAGKVFLPAGGSSLLNARMEELLQPKNLMAGMYDINTTEPVKVTVVFCPAAEEPVHFLRHAKVLPKDKEALRGTFPGMNRTVKARGAYDPDKDGIVYIPVGDNRYDVYKRGVDATDGSEAVNYGNYGILYRYELPLQGDHKTCLQLSPLGGSYTGAVRVEMNRREARVVQTPMGRLFFGEKTAPELALNIGRSMLLNEDFELANIGTYSAYKKFALEYSPPGSSNMPVLLILSPAGGDRHTDIHREREWTVVRESPLHRRRSEGYERK